MRLDERHALVVGGDEAGNERRQGICCDNDELSKTFVSRHVVGYYGGIMILMRDLHNAGLCQQKCRETNRSRAGHGMAWCWCFQWSEAVIRVQ